MNRPLALLKINNENVEVTHKMFSSVLVDSELNWSYQIRYIKDKILKGTELLLKAQNIVNRSTLKTLYYSFI